MTHSLTPQSSNRTVETSQNSRLLNPESYFPRRHIGPSEADVAEMLALLGAASLDELSARTVPAAIAAKELPDLPAALDEHAMLHQLSLMGARNKPMRSFIGMGYHSCITAPVIRRNILENPGWYTQYTPYQAEIAQGRLEALLNFQTMIADLTALPMANASLLDESTAAAEAMSMCRALTDSAKTTFFISEDCHPQTIAVVQQRAAGLGIICAVGNAQTAFSQAGNYFGILLQYPTTRGTVINYAPLVDQAHKAGALVVVAADILALTLLRPPGEFGADIAVGSTQRLGMPMGFGGPHAAFMATRREFARKMPGRIVGVSRDAQGNPALRLAIQTREQHIKREKATSNICTAQVLPAVVAAMHAIYHGPSGLRAIARRIHGWTAVLAAGLAELGHQPDTGEFFDTLCITPAPADSARRILADAAVAGINLRLIEPDQIGISLDELTTAEEIGLILNIFARHRPLPFNLDALIQRVAISYPAGLARESEFMTHPVFSSYQSETDMQRYMRRLESRDLSLTTSMIPLGSCTMKLNAAAEMLPITWRCWADLHPFAPAAQTGGYQLLFDEMESALCQITGFAGVSLQPNAGSQGEYTGLMVIRAFHQAQGHTHRDICLIPQSAHGTNPASAVVAGMKVVVVACRENGDVDIDDLRAKALEHQNNLAALMVTYPSTHGVFEEGITEICSIVHAHGGQVYMDGANMNAMVGLCRPADIGADVCHLNLHKTFCIPHGGGGPGMGPIAVAAHLKPYLPGHPVTGEGGHNAIGPVSAASHGSALILTIPWAYIRMMGAQGLRRATQVAILNANYMARRLATHYPVLFRGKSGYCAHEFIIDARAFESSAGIRVEDIAKRLMDFGFHAPTVSWPEPGTLMIEPTESESRAELDRFCDALIAIRAEIAAIEQGKMDRTDNPLKNAPHTAQQVSADQWHHAYTRQQAAWPLDSLRDHKFWPAVARIDNPYGDRNLVCSCPPVSPA